MRVEEVAMGNIVDGFKKVDLSSFPNFCSMSTSQELGLWVLLVAKESGLARKLTAEQIAQVIVDVYEISVQPRAITNALNRAGTKVHVTKMNKITFFEIMVPGKEFIRSIDNGDLTDMFYFEPGKRFNSKRVLATKVLDTLRGELKIVDPYCGERTLDILCEHRTSVKILTRLDNLSTANRAKLIREVADFKSEYRHIEFRNYLGVDIHDRYILSDDGLVILGTSLNALGGKESIAVVLERRSNQNIFDEMLSAFNRRWKSATVI